MNPGVCISGVEEPSSLCKETVPSRGANWAARSLEIRVNLSAGVAIVWLPMMVGPWDTSEVLVEMFEKSRKELNAHDESSTQLEVLKLVVIGMCRRSQTRSEVCEMTDYDTDHTAFSLTVTVLRFILYELLSIICCTA